MLKSFLITALIFAVALILSFGLSSNNKKTRIIARYVFLAVSFVAFWMATYQGLH